MPVGYTSQRSVQVLGFGNFGYLTPLHRLIRFLFVRPAFCLGLPSDSQSPATPLPLANTSPCRVCRGLSPPSHQRGYHSRAGCANAQRAMPGAQAKKPVQCGFCRIWAMPIDAPLQELACQRRRQPNHQKSPAAKETSIAARPHRRPRAKPS